MQTTMQTTRASKIALWTGRVLSALAVLFLFMDGLGKVIRDPAVVKATVQLGYPESLVVSLGLLLLACTVVYLVPQTSVLGALLLTGYLGGAAASNLRVGSPLLSHVLFPVYLGLLVWVGLYWRDKRLHFLLPLRKNYDG